MKITVKQLKQLIREQVEEMAMSGMPEARHAARQVSVKDPEGLAEAMKELGYGRRKYIALSPVFVLIRDMEIPGQYWPLVYEDNMWSEGDGPVNEQGGPAGV
jgi:hypothetical protein